MPGYMEPMATLASMGGDGRLTVWTSTQSVFLARARYAEALEMPVSKIRVIRPAPAADSVPRSSRSATASSPRSLASRLDRPVRMAYNRLEDFAGTRLAGRARAPEDGRGCRRTHRRQDVTILADCGAYPELTAHVMYVTAMRSDNMHRIENVAPAPPWPRTTRRAVPSRGFGGQQMGSRSTATSTCWHASSA